ncbi:cupin [Sphingomonas metalli]|uniref:Cupin n=1 Tax=Sphingomonas metalli TaxID=1779358 RepID=A0A916WZ27_9SPHN|nr:cupin-like domain-containing protein [Sphingomonas metalli]GGB41883.1 cupin [Sphingomonas metalli]
MTDAIQAAPRVPEIDGITPERFAAEIVPAYRPVVLRGLVRHWPAVAAGRGGAAAMAAYVRSFDGGKPAQVMIAAPQERGRFFYTPDMAGFNFTRAQVMLPVLLDQLVAQQDDPAAPALYAGAATAADSVPGWVEANPLPLATPEATPRLWIGNASRVSTHYDVSSNIAAVVAGRRRFVLFPPDQGPNLYVGPLDQTIAGQPTSMVDLEAPDLARYPRFTTAMAAMQVAELEPGDAIFVPSLWWHDVTATGPLNLLVNYWWGQQAAASPFAALIHALLAVRDLPAGERQAVRGWFDQYVFGEGAQQAGAHLPKAARGVLDLPSHERADRIRAYLMRALGRG